MEILETEMRQKGIIPITEENLEKIKKTNDKQRLAEFTQCDQDATHYTTEVKKNIESIERILSLVYNDLDNNLMHRLNLFLKRLKDCEWKSAMYESTSLLSWQLLHPNASTLFSQLKEIYDELEKIHTVDN